MSKMVQIRNVPEALHRKLKVRAAGSGQTLSDYLLAELERLAARPTRDEMLPNPQSKARSFEDTGRGGHPAGARVGVIVDASALLEFLLQTPLGTRVERPRHLRISPTSISTVTPISIS